MQRARQGALLREGIKVVIAGQPNAGKSSLLNALAGAELAIVTPVPGTTRDVVSQTIQIEGVPLHVIDTAGLRDSQDHVEKIGIERAWGQIESADAVLFLHDLTRAGDADYAAGDEAIARGLADKLPPRVPVIEVWNKLDAVPEGVAPRRRRRGRRRFAFGQDRRRPGRAAPQAAGGGRLASRARGRVHRPRTPRPGAAAGRGASAGSRGAPRARGPRSLELLAEELRLAQNALNEITGEFSADDLLGVIFSQLLHRKVGLAAMPLPGRWRTMCGFTTPGRPVGLR